MDSYFTMQRQQKQGGPETLVLSGLCTVLCRKQGGRNVFHFNILLLKFLRIYLLFYRSKCLGTFRLTFFCCHNKRLICSLCSPCVVFFLFNILHDRSSFVKDFPGSSEAFLHLPSPRAVTQRQPPHSPTHTPSLLWPSSYPRIFLYELACTWVAYALSCVLVREPRHLLFIE